MKLILQLLALVVILSFADLTGKTLIFPPAALSDLVKLGPARIEARWKPRSIPDGYFPTVEGYYVIYNHDKLSLFFGPVDSEPEAVKIQFELEKTRTYLISQNPSLSSSTVGRINIDFGGEAPTAQTDANDLPPEGLKPVRILSGNSTLELGKENEAQSAATGSTTDGPLSSDYGPGSSTEGTADNPPDSEGEETGPSESNEPAADGAAETSDETDAPPGSGILNVLSQGPSAPGNKPGEFTGGPDLQNQNTGTDSGSPNGTDSAPNGEDSAGGPNSPGHPVPASAPQTVDSTGGANQKTGGLQGTESPSQTQPSVNGPGTESPGSPGEPEASDSGKPSGSLNSTPGSGELGKAGQETGQKSNPGPDGSGSGSSSPQTPTAPPDTLKIPATPPSLPQAQPGSQAPIGTKASAQFPDQPEGEPANNRQPGAASEALNAVDETGQGDPTSQQASAETSPSESTSVESTSEDPAEASSPAGEVSPANQTQTTAPPEPASQTTDLSEEIMDEPAEDAQPDAEESPEEMLNSPPPSPASLELGTNNGLPVSEAATIRINHLLKNKLVSTQ